MKWTEIRFIEDRAFVALERGQHLCIGSSEEVRKASADRIAEMIYEARAYEKFFGIEEDVDLIIH